MTETALRDLSARREQVRIEISNNLGEINTVEVRLKRDATQLRLRSRELFAQLQDIDERLAAAQR